MGLGRGEEDRKVLTHISPSYSSINECLWDSPGTSGRRENTWGLGELPEKWEQGKGKEDEYGGGG